jgi:restriction system protein
MPDKRPMAIALYVGYWRRFLWDAQIGDIVVLGTRDRKVAIGEFTGPYTYVANGDERARHRRPVSWKGVGIDRSAMGEDLLKTMNSQHTVQDFKAVKAAARLRVLAETQIDPGR